MKWLATTGIALALIGVSPAFAASVGAQLFPSGPTVPENLLRIEVLFSAPLDAPFEVEQARLYKGDGQVIADAFLDLPLLSTDRQSVTLLLHPGRVKSGVGANLALGRALRVDEVITLVVDLPSHAEPLRKTWRVTPAMLDAPNPERWDFTAPEVETLQPIVLRLHDPISSTAEKLIAIRGPEGERVAGVAHLEVGETVWSFVPNAPWRPEPYAIVVNADLEDPCGNRPGARFESFHASRSDPDAGNILPFVPRKT